MLVLVVSHEHDVWSQSGPRWRTPNTPGTIGQQHREVAESTHGSLVPELDERRKCARTEPGSW